MRCHACPTPCRPRTIRAVLEVVFDHRRDRLQAGVVGGRRNREAARGMCRPDRRRAPPGHQHPEGQEPKGLAQEHSDEIGKQALGQSCDAERENRRQEGRIEQRAIAYKGLIHNLRQPDPLPGQQPAIAIAYPPGTAIGMVAKQQGEGPSMHSGAPGQRELQDPGVSGDRRILPDQIPEPRCVDRPTSSARAADRNSRRKDRRAAEGTRRAPRSVQTAPPVPAHPERDRRRALGSRHPPRPGGAHERTAAIRSASGQAPDHPDHRDPRAPGPRTAGFRAETRQLGGTAIDGEGMI